MHEMICTDFSYYMYQYNLSSFNSMYDNTLTWNSKFIKKSMIFYESIGNYFEFMGYLINNECTDRTLRNHYEIITVLNTFKSRMGLKYKEIMYKIHAPQYKSQSGTQINIHHTNLKYNKYTNDLYINDDVAHKVIKFNHDIIQKYNSSFMNIDNSNICANVYELYCLKLKEFSDTFLTENNYVLGDDNEFIRIYKGRYNKIYPTLR